MSVADNAQVLARAEDRLRAVGLTGGQAFAALLAAIRSRLGDTIDTDPIAVQALADLQIDGGGDLIGLAYERFFADLFKGRKGQYFTPRPIVELVLERASLGPGVTVLDPTCGSGAFLVSAARRGADVRGIEIDPYLADLARINLRLAGFDAKIHRGDFFVTDPDPVDVVVANPPFSVEISDREVLDRYALGRGRRRVLSDWLFIEALERWVRPGGCAAIVIPWSVVVNPYAASLRERIDENWHREAICGLPEGVFRPFGGAAGRAFVLWLRRVTSTEPTRWANVTDPGYDVRSRAVRPTDSTEVQRLVDGEGWADLPDASWIPAASGGGRQLAEVANVRNERIMPSRDPKTLFASIDLADSERATGEVIATQVAGRDLIGPRVGLRTGDVLVARLRPNLGNVAVARMPVDFDGPLVGSPEWIALEFQEAPHYALHALRSPTWRQQLPVTGGQTRPRTTAADVLASRVPWPEDVLATRVDALSRKLHEERANLRGRLDGLQGLVDRYAAGEIDEAALAVELGALED